MVIFLVSGADLFVIAIIVFIARHLAQIAIPYFSWKKVVNEFFYLLTFVSASPAIWVWKKTKIKIKANKAGLNFISVILLLKFW